MQKLWENRNKRKHTQDGLASEERETKHTKHNNRHSYASSSSKSMDRLSQTFTPSLDFSDQKRKASSSQKISNLLAALDEVVEEEGLDELISLVGEQDFGQCQALRSSLQKHKPKLDADASYHPTASQKQAKSKKSHDDFWDLPKTMSPFSITPWKSSIIPLTLPPLPEVLDPTLETSAFVHASCGSGRPTDLSYERLEWVGDAYVYLISTLLISQTFPFLTPGKSSQMRERLVKNITLADFSRQYGFEQRLQLPDQLRETMTKEHDRMKIMGDVFEAYVAAVVLSDPVDGLTRVAEWLKDIWGMTIAKEILHEERSGMRLDSPLWRLRGKAEPVQQIIAPSHAMPLNAKDQLQKLIVSRGVKLEYKDAALEQKDPRNKLPMFTVGVYLHGWGEKDKLLGSGRANGKKDAGMKAAEMAMANKKLMKAYTEKKRIFDEHLALEKAALEKHGGA